MKRSFPFFPVLVAVLSLTAGSLCAGKPSMKPGIRPIEAADMKDLQGVWINDIPDKSVTVSIDKIDAFTGQLTGTAKVVAGNFNREVPLTGWVTVSPTSGAKENGDRRIVFSFSACIGELGMVNSWSGIYAVIDGKPLLLTHWIQNRALSGYSWDHSIVGEERFHRPEEQ